jgi:4-hydroxyphenylacetate 3-monooxygenase
MATVAKTGTKHIESLRDGRAVYIDGALVGDVTKHAAFGNAIKSAAHLYDYQADPGNLEDMTFVSPTSGGRVSRAWQIPRSYEEMVQRRRALTRWAALHGGFLGRSPDHVASALAGQYAGIDRFREYDERFACNFANYFEYARDADLFLTYVIINPQVDRSRSASEQEAQDVVMRVVDEDSSGITVRGAKMMGTSTIMANEVFVANLQPLKPEEAKYAVSFALPMNTPGLKVLSRKSYEAHAASLFDNPLAARFDENDAVVFFDDVKVPWERVFVNQDVRMAHAQFHETPGHINQNYQAQIRLMVKLKFLAGIARRIAETIGTVKLPPVQTTLGKLASDAAVVEALVHGMEAAGEKHGDAYVPNRHLVYAAQVFTQELYANFTNAIRDLAGGALVMLPSSAQDYGNDELSRIIDGLQQSPICSPRERVKFLKLAWDALGSEFAGRHNQYEMFYAGAQFVTRGHSYRTYDWDGAGELVDNLLEGYELEDSILPLATRQIA